MLLRTPFRAFKPLSIQRLAGADSTAQKGSLSSAIAGSAEHEPREATESVVKYNIGDILQA